MRSRHQTNPSERFENPPIRERERADLANRTGFITNVSGRRGPEKVRHDAARLRIEFDDRNRSFGKLSAAHGLVAGGRQESLYGSETRSQETNLLWPWNTP